MKSQYKDDFFRKLNIPFKKGKKILDVGCDDGSDGEKKDIGRAFAELRRACKKGGCIIIVEGNRYNPLFYPHMVLLRGHQHFKQPFFTHAIKNSYKSDKVLFRFFEAHMYPEKFLSLFKIYEYFMEHIAPKQFLAYNAAIVKKQ